MRIRIFIKHKLTVAIHTGEQENKSDARFFVIGFNGFLTSEIRTKPKT